MTKKCKVTYRVQRGDEYTDETFIAEIIESWKLGAIVQSLMDEVEKHNKFDDADGIDIIGFERIEE
jgi:hypothetical protein